MMSNAIDQTIDTLIRHIEECTPEQLVTAIRETHAAAHDPTRKPAGRLLYKGCANLLRLYRRKLG